MQDAFLKLWERWDRVDRLDDPTGYLFRVALNGFRMRTRAAIRATRRLVPVASTMLGNPTRSRVGRGTPGAVSATFAA
jgi:DNA-directed RNA polymerase specialized sigma24 family protein